MNGSRNRRLAVGALAVAILVAAVFVYGLRSHHSAPRQGERRVAAPPPEPRRAARGQQPPTRAPARAVVPELPEAGEMSISVGEGGITVAANQILRLELLRALAARTGFELVDRGGRHPLVTIAIADASLPEVLAEVLAGSSYELHYEARKGGRSVLARLQLGRPSALALEERRRRRAERDDGLERARQAARERDPEERERERARRRAERAEVASASPLSADELRRRQERRRRDLLADLEHEDPEERAFAAASLDAEVAEDRMLLEQMILNDPDPMVRAEAAQQLGFGKREHVAGLLRDALSDPSPDVVVAASESLAFLDDAGAVPMLRRLLRHPDDSVQTAAGDAIEVLELAR